MAAGLDIATATYVYGVMERAPAIRTDGVTGARVATIEHGRLAALTSSVGSTALRARRRDLLAHQEVLQEAFASGTVLPLRFGTLFPDDRAVVSQLLEPQHDRLVELLERFENLVELTVRASYVEDAVLREVVREDADVARLRRRAVSDLALGEAVAHALSAKRAAEAGTIERALLRLAEDAVIEQPRTELEVFRGAFLVKRAALGAFDAAMNERARERDGVVVFKYVGPLPPHTFVDAVVAD